MKEEIVEDLEESYQKMVDEYGEEHLLIIGVLDSSFSMLRPSKFCHGDLLSSAVELLRVVAEEIDPEHCPACKTQVAFLTETIRKIETTLGTPIKSSETKH